MHPLGWMVDGLLKGALQMWEGCSAASKPHVRAEVVTPLLTELTSLAGESAFNGDLVVQVEAVNISTHGKDGAARLVAETKRLPHKNRSVPAMSVVMEIRTTQSRCSDGYLNLVWPQRGEIL